MPTSGLMEKTAAYVRELYQSRGDEKLVYHSLAHTEGVVRAAEQIADHYQLEETDYLAVYIAAWFHDTGYLSGLPQDHEERGADLAEEFLRREEADPLLIAKVRQCILATRLGHEPQTLIEKVIADADLFHFGTESFRESNRNMRRETELRRGESIPGREWRRAALAMLKSHHFHTDYCRALLQKGKLDNIARLEAREAEQRLKDEQRDEQKQALGAGGGNGSLAAAAGNASDKPKKPARGIETMFRTTSINHLHLSEMADNKAHILLTINSIIVSILVTLLFRKIDDDSKLLIPGLMFLFTSLVTIVFAVLVTRPNITSGVFTKEDIRNKTANLLFFGNFHRMDLQDYQWGVAQMMKDADFLYGSMTRDIYNLGVVLGRKYKLLNYAYGVFMFGFIISALSFVIVVLD